MAYSLTYMMLTGRGVHLSLTAGEAVKDHAGLLQAGASDIVIRDTHLLVVTLAAVTAQGKLDAHRT